MTVQEGRCGPGRPGSLSATGHVVSDLDVQDVSTKTLYTTLALSRCTKISPTSFDFKVSRISTMYAVNIV